MLSLPQFYSDTPLSAVPEVLDKYAPYYADWLKHDCYDEYWRKIAIRERYDSISLPVLHVGGWYDVFLSGTIKNFVELDKRAKEHGDGRKLRQQLMVGPWYHVPWQSQFGAADFGADAANTVNTTQLKWFDHYLRHEPSQENETDDDSRISVFVLNSNKWQTFSEWPPRNSIQSQFYLHSGGRANSVSGDGTLSKHAPGEEPWDGFIYDPSCPVPSLGGHSCCFDQIAPMGPCDQRANQGRNDVLVYSSKALASDMTLMGQIVLKLHAASTAGDTDFSAILSVVHECGKSINLANGIIRGSRRESLIHPRRLEPGEVYEFTIKLGWTAALIKKGQRFRLEISSSNFPHYSINANNGGRAADAELTDFRPARQTVFHDSRYPSHLLLPLLNTL